MSSIKIKIKIKIQNENSYTIKSVPFFLNKGAKIGIFGMRFLPV